MGELVVSAKSQLERNAERFHGHDRDGANGGTDRDVDQRVLLAVDGGDTVDHYGREDRDSQTVQQKACEVVSTMRDERVQQDIEDGPGCRA